MSAITARGLTKRFGNLVAVDQLDLDIPKSAVYGFLGPNGSGKSTTIRLLCGLLTPNAGQVSVLGMQIPAQAEALKKRIGYMTQKFSLYEDLSVRENLQFLAQIQGMPPKQVKQRVDEVLSEYRMQSRAQQLAGTLSGGQKQRLALAGCILHKPELLLLDEPTSAVDPESRREFWDHLFALADSGTTLLVSTHFMDEAERCHRLAILDQGRLVADGSPQQLMADLPYRVFVVTQTQTRQAYALLRELPEVAGCAQIGNALRLLVKPETSIAQLQAKLTAQNLQASISLSSPNLEDVFVAATKPFSENRLAEA